MVDFNPDQWLDELNEEEVELKINRLEGLNRELRIENNGLWDKIMEYQGKLKMALSIREPHDPKPIKRRARKGKEACPIGMASDWHVEEEVRPETVNGKNKYDLKIAKKRSENFFDGLAENTKSCQRDALIKDLILWLGGDMITNYLHEENKKGNLLSPMKAILFCQALLIAGINYLLEELELERLVVITNYGNHGRSTRKPEYATGAEGNYEWMMYHTLAQHYADDERVEFIIEENRLVYFNVFNQRVRFHHGDDIRYGGGIGGLNVPLHKAIYSWNQTDKADLSIIGHWHNFVDYNHTVVNGSLIGYNAYCVAKKIPFQPPKQGFVLMDKRHGKDLVRPIWV